MRVKLWVGFKDQRAGAVLDQGGGARAIDDIAKEGGAGDAADGQRAGGVGGVADGADGAREAGDGGVTTVDVELAVSLRTRAVVCLTVAPLPRVNVPLFTVRAP